MATVPYDFQQGAMMGLASANLIGAAGGTDSTVSGNATIALLRAAIEALAPTAGAAPDALRQISLGLQWALNAGAVASTHTATTRAGLAAIIQGNLTGIDIPSTFDGYLSQ